VESWKTETSSRLSVYIGSSRAMSHFLGRSSFVAPLMSVSASEGASFEAYQPMGMGIGKLGRSVGFRDKVQTGIMQLHSGIQSIPYTISDI